MVSLTRKPSRERAKRPSEEPAPIGEKRLLADIPADLHRKVRMRCLERGILVQDYIVELLAKDGLTSAYPRPPGRESAGT